MYIYIYVYKSIYFNIISLQEGKIPDTRNSLPAKRKIIIIIKKNAHSL